MSVCVCEEKKGGGRNNRDGGINREKGRVRKSETVFYAPDLVILLL